jgi:spermidine synthase
VAIIWSKSTAVAHFEVRRAGNSVRLYRNGVFHSQFNERRPISATPWSLLLLPAYFRPAGKVQRVLVLGVGGGAVIRLLQHCLNPDEIVGVELDPTHIAVARRFFGVSTRMAQLVQADARDWLHSYRGPPFDLIIDDLFGEAEGEPLRAVEPGPAWLSSLSRHLSRDGVLVMNFVGSRDLKAAASTLRTLTPRNLTLAYRLGLPDYDNVIGAFMGQREGAESLRRSLRRDLSPCAAGLSKIPFTVRRVSS